MSWLQLRIDTSATLAPSCEEHLLLLGAVAVTLQDNADEPLFMQDREATPLWQDTCVTGLFPAATDTETLWNALPDEIRNSCQHRAEILEDKDWEREWMRHYQPLQFGDKLWICPGWLEPPDPDAVNIMMDPGLAFGTGSHPTTAMCVRAIAALDLAGKRVIDYGCGSGVLGIAALLHGAEHVLAIDTDPQALVATRNNANRNAIPVQQLDVSLPQASSAQVDVVIANILAGPLCQLAPTLCQHLLPAGKILLSGILVEQQQDLLQAYQGYLQLEILSQQDAWLVLYGQRQ